MGQQIFTLPDGRKLVIADEELNKFVEDKGKPLDPWIESLSPMTMEELLRLLPNDSTVRQFATTILDHFNKAAGARLQAHMHKVAAK